MSFENLLRTRPEETDTDHQTFLSSFSWIINMAALTFSLTDGVDVEEADGRPEDGVEHAVVQRLCTLDQHVEQEEVPGEAEDDGGCCQTCSGATKLHTHTILDNTRSRVNNKNNIITSINAQVEVCVQLSGDVHAALDDGAVDSDLLLLISPEQNECNQR